MSAKRPTLEDIAKLAQVSRATVSLVVRQSPLVAKSTRQKVEKIMADLDYVRDLGAARLRSNSSHTIGVIVPNLVNSFFTEYLSGIEPVTERDDRVVLLANSHDDAARQNQILQRFRGHGVDGIILCPAQGTAEDLPQKLLSWGIPVVQSLREVGQGITDYAGADYRQAVSLAVGHLVQRGHRHIAFLSVKARTSARRDRMEGFADALVQTKAVNFGIVETDLTWEAAAAAAADILALKDRPTAVLCFNDVLAAGLMAGLREAGCEPGSDMAVIGLDDLELCRLTHPALSSVAVNPAQIGANAARLLQARLNHLGAPIRRSIAPPRLIIRQSTPNL